MQTLEKMSPEQNALLARYGFVNVTGLEVTHYGSVLGDRIDRVTYENHQGTWGIFGEGLIYVIRSLSGEILIAYRRLNETRFPIPEHELAEICPKGQYQGEDPLKGGSIRMTHLLARIRKF